MKRLTDCIFVVMIIFCSLAYANSGPLFKITQSGAATSVDIILCLNGKGPLSCQNYHASAHNLAISTTVNHHYPAAGIKILTPGYRPTGCTVYANGYCLFSANSQTATAIVLNANVPATYSIGGTISGLIGTVSIQNNGADTLDYSTDGNFTFATSLPAGESYDVTVSTQPLTQTCTVNNASGTIGNSNVTDVQVTCSTDSYTVGGMISGLSGSISLQNNGDILTQGSDGSFTFATSMAEGSDYNVTVLSKPANQVCTVNNGSGTIGNSNVVNVQVTCSTNSATVGGTISGLTDSVSLQINDNDTLIRSTNGSYAFATPVAQGASYNVTVLSDPATQTCEVSNGSGVMGATNVTNVDVTCINNTTTLSVDANGTIPVNGGPGSVTITNTGLLHPATNVSIVLPSGWGSAVTQDSSDCLFIAPGSSCTITLTATKPYIAQGNLQVVGDNIENSPTTALAFTVGGYLVWEVTSPTVVQVLDTSNLGAIQWGNSVSTFALSKTLGLNNTISINGTIGIGASAAVNCYNSTNGGSSPGTWYLPAICQMGGANQGAECSQGLANINNNLFRLGFGNLSGIYWSSTESRADLAWTQFYYSNTDYTQDEDPKNIPYNVRCVRSMSY
jgi:trimeric autotransporter adhesin